MAAERLSMRQVREILRLKFENGLGSRKIAASYGGVGRTTVDDYVARFKAAGLSWPLPDELDDAQLEARLFPATAPPMRVMPDFGAIDVQLRRKGVTLQLLWTEYCEQNGDRSYQLSRFCELYGEWRRKNRMWMRQHHKAGDKMFVDFSGDGLEIIDPQTGEVQAVKLFVAAMGASSYTFAYAVLDEKLPSFLHCNVRALEFFGGVPAAIVPDNPKTAVTKADRYEPEIHDAYADFGRHYATCIMPARPYQPRDKAKVEVAVLVAQRSIVAVLRNQTFYNLDDLNDAVLELVGRINHRVMRHVGRTRAQLFAEIDQPALKPLPKNRYEHATWKKARVHPDYHVEVDKHFYSVPYQHRGEAVLIRLTATSVEVLLNGKRVASHARSRRRWHYTTLPEHRPPAHMYVADSTVEQMRQRAGRIGPNTSRLFEALFAERQYPEQAVKSCLGVLSLVEPFGADRVEAACRRALHFSLLKYKHIKNILQRGLDAQSLDDKQPETNLPRHENVRGSSYFH